MAAGPGEYRAMLVSSILLASSQEQVKSFIDTALRMMERNKVNKHLIARFIRIVIGDLESFNPTTRETQQWENIKVAIIFLNRKWIESNTPTD